MAGVIVVGPQGPIDLLPGVAIGDIRHVACCPIADCGLAKGAVVEAAEDLVVAIEHHPRRAEMIVEQVAGLGGGGAARGAVGGHLRDDDAAWAVDVQRLAAARLFDQAVAGPCRGWWWCCFGRGRRWARARV